MIADDARRRARDKPSARQAAREDNSIGSSSDAPPQPTPSRAKAADSSREGKRLEFASDEGFGSWLEGLLAEADVVLDEDAEAGSVKAFCTCSYCRRNGHERTIAYAWVR